MNDVTVAIIQNPQLLSGLCRVLASHAQHVLCVSLGGDALSRPVEEHVQGPGRRWPRPSGRAGQPDRRRVAGPAPQTQHPAHDSGLGADR